MSVSLALCATYAFVGVLVGAASTRVVTESFEEHPAGTPLIRAAVCAIVFALAAAGWPVVTVLGAVGVLRGN